MKSLIALFSFIVLTVSSEDILSDQSKKSLRLEIHQLINELREKKKRTPLILNDTLRQAAEFHSDYLAKTNRFSHIQRNKKFKTPTKRVDYFKGTDFEIVAENIVAISFEEDEFDSLQIKNIAEEAVNLWRNSKGHYQNIIDRELVFADIGISINSEKKYIYITQVFGSKSLD